MPGDIDGLIHLSDLDASRPGEEAIKEFRKGDRVRAKVLEIDVEKGAHQPQPRATLEEEKVAGALAPYSRGQVVTCVVTEVTDSGLRVTVDEVNGFIRRSDLSKLRTDQNPHRFAVGERVDAKVVSIDTKAARLVLSIKSLEIEEGAARAPGIRVQRIRSVARRHPERGAEAEGGVTPRWRICSTV